MGLPLGQNEEVAKAAADTAKEAFNVMGGGPTFWLLLIITGLVFFLALKWLNWYTTKKDEAIENLRRGLEMAVQRAADDAREHKILFHTQVTGLTIEQANELFRKANANTPQESLREQEDTETSENLGLEERRP